MHPLVRNLYKRVLSVGHDYPTGIAHVKEKWKKAIFDPNNCPSCYNCHHSTKGINYRNNDEGNNLNKTTSTDTIRNNNTIQLCSSTDTSKNRTVINFKESKQCEEEIFFAVNKGRWFVKEMIGVIKLKKYRTMKQRYGSNNNNDNIELENAMKNIENRNNDNSNSIDNK